MAAEDTRGRIFFQPCGVDGVGGPGPGDAGGGDRPAGGPGVGAGGDVTDEGAGGDHLKDVLDHSLRDTAEIIDSTEGVEDGRVARVRDYIHVDYLLADADVV